MTIDVTTSGLVLDEQAQSLLFREARTANAFTDEPIGEETIRTIYELVKWGPTSFNQQPLRVVLVRSPEAREKLVEHMIDNNKEKTRKAPLVAIMGADTDFHENLPTQLPFLPNAKEMFFSEYAVREDNARLNAALQIAYYIIGIRAAGLAAGPMSGFDAEAVSEMFFPGGKHKALVVINIGKPAPNAWWGRLPRLEFDAVHSVV